LVPDGSSATRSGANDCSHSTLCSGASSDSRCLIGRCVAHPLVERVCSNWVWRLPPGQGLIALTFDDSPDSTTTHSLLAALDSAEIKATFFLNGENCAANAKVLREAADRGHILANHGHCHRSHLFRAAAFQRRNILAADEELQRLDIPSERLFRPPYGSFNPLTSHVLKRIGYVGVLWSLMVWDWLEQDASIIWNRLESGLHDGAIIVLHDSHSTTKNVIGLIPRLAETVYQRGWRFVPLTSSTVSR
jgi:peptidoglycan-N-acetylglucosamine deacetylase